MVAVYGYNMIQAVERFMAVILTLSIRCGIVALGMTLLFFAHLLAQSQPHRTSREIRQSGAPRLPLLREVPCVLQYDLHAFVQHVQRASITSRYPDPSPVLRN